VHRSIPNTSGLARYGVDFRAVVESDVVAGTGAPTADAHCTGTSIRDFRRVADDRPLDEETVVSLFGPPPEDALLVFGDDEAQPSPA
jgi:hypothetical protein